MSETRCVALSVMTTTVPRLARGVGRRRTLAELLDPWKDKDERMILAGRLDSMPKVPEHIRSDTLTI